MKSNPTGPNRLSRVAAKEVPHRSDERFFAAKADVKKACEDLLHDLRHSSAHAPMVADLETAVKRVQQQVKDITPDEPKATSAVKDMAKEVQHLQVAENWVSATERVLTRLGGSVTAGDARRPARGSGHGDVVRACPALGRRAHRGHLEAAEAGAGGRGARLAGHRLT